jgi:parallel beta-helix repeat protein
VRITGCFIGTDASGTQARPNQTGIEVHTSHVSIGGDRIGLRNLISGNTGNGVKLRDEVQTGARVLGNWIGTDRTGVSRLGNGRSGIRSVQSEALIGGDEISNTANTIRYNGGDGVVVASGSGNRIQNNTISDNGGLGIDLNDDGVSPNDAGDVDGGANGTQNRPVITVATATSVQGTLHSTPNKTFSVRFFSNLRGDEGRFFRGGPIPVTTDASGNATFAFRPDAPIPAGETVTATATGGNGTSEFSAPVRVT